MKYLASSLASIVVAFFLIATTSTTATAQSTKDQFEVKVDGLGCPFCAYGLEKKFKEFKGIKDVKIEMETGMMTFNYPTDKMLTMERVEKQVDEAGYTAVHVKVTRADGSQEETAAVAAVEVNENEVIETSFFVAGNCGMCKARIEKTAKSVAGVTKAEWNKKTKQLSILFDQSMTSQEAVEAAVAGSGHDTKTAIAEAVVYNALPGCCQYDRNQ